MQQSTSHYRKSWAWAVVLATAAGLFCGGAAALEVDSHSFAGGGGMGLGGTLFVPEGAGPFPLAVVSHGWASSGAYQVGWGRTIAEQGFVVVVLSYPDPLMPDVPKNKSILLKLVEFFRNAPSSSPAAGKVDPELLVLVGHSMGGLISSLVAMELRPTVMVLFDPVDASSDAVGKMDALCSPVLTLLADRSSCNEMGAWRHYLSQISGPSISFSVKGATHCDGEKPARPECGPLCGGAASATVRGEFERYALAMILGHVQNDQSQLAILDEAALFANPLVAELKWHGDNPPCSDPEPPDTETQTQGDTETQTQGDTDLPKRAVTTGCRAAPVGAANQTLIGLLWRGSIHTK